MEGFDGDSMRAAALDAALSGLLAVFPEHLAKPHAPEPFSGEDLVKNEQFDGILRAHKKDRLTIPIQALRRTGAPYHGFASMPARRLAWFVPTLLASWLVREISTSELAELVPDPAWTDEEAFALTTFFAHALAAALATPLPPARADDPRRPLEDGVRVWSLHSPSVPLDVLRVARALDVPLEPLVEQWALDASDLALDHLLEAVFDTKIASKHYLAHEAVAERLASAFFGAKGKRQQRLSKAEVTVRRNIARREDF